jgi:hypothetical protein
MNKRSCYPIALAIALACLSATCAAQQKPAADKPAAQQPTDQKSDPKAKTLWEQKTGTGETDFSKFLVDTSNAQISAFSLLGVPTDAIANVENVRDVTVAAKGLASNDQGFGISVTPARTSWSPMNLADYADSAVTRVLGALTLGYAQGNKTISGTEFARQAFSIESNVFWQRDDDPLIVTATAIRKCQDADAERQAILKGAKPDAKADTGGDAARRPAEGDAQLKKDADAAFAKCQKPALSAIRWNRSQLSFSFATGRIQPDSGGASESLGRTAALGITYGFENFPSLIARDKLAAYLTLRRAMSEPVLETLTTGNIERKSSTLGVFRLAGGSKILRALVEASNADSSQITSTQRAYKRALGVDYRVADNTWLNFRIGSQRTIDGTQDQTSSLISLSYSPGALLK